MTLEQVIARKLVECAAIYNRTIANTMVEVYARLLSGHSPESVDAAFDRHMNDPERGQYFPKPADLIAQIQALKPNIEQSALLAWAEVPVLLRNSRAAKSANPITEAAVRDLGGWVTLGQKTEQELIWVAKEFCERYATFAEHGVEAAAQITGKRKGLQGPAGLLIGLSH